MEQQIRFCTTSDGVRIAYASVGEGPPLVYVCGWPQHLELEWETPFARGFLERLARGGTLVRYDMRGGGLSDHRVPDFSLGALVRDLDAVIDQLALEQFALLSFGALAGPIAITYAAAYPERVTYLVLHSAYLWGSEIAPAERQQALVEYVESFGLPTFDLIDHPGASIDQQRDFRDLQRALAPRQTLAALLRTIYAADVRELVDRLSMPILIMHGRGDPIVPFAAGRELAACLPRARFVPFESDTGALWALADVLIPEIRRFLGLAEEAQEAVAAAGPVTILFTDVEGSTALTQRLGDAGAREVLRQHERIVRECLRSHGGSEVKTMGDGFMASFSSAARAVGCAIAIQRAFAEWNAGVGAYGHAPLQIRVGLNAGEPIAEGEDLFGTAVNLAARIAGEAKGEEILVANVVRELAAGKGFAFVDRGDVALKGFEEPVRLYEVRWEG